MTTDMPETPEAGFADHELVAPSMAALLAEATREHAGRPAFSCILPNGAYATLAFQDIGRQSDALAFYLREGLGLAPGDVVAIQSPNCLAYPVAAYAAMKAGLTLTGINPLYTAGEANHQLRDSGARALFVIDLFGDRLDEALSGTDVEHVIRLSVVDFFPAHKRALIHAVMKYARKQIPPMRRPSVALADALRRGAALQRGRSVLELTKDRSLDDVAIFQYTSGTTGRSKGAELTERNLLVNITQQDRYTGPKVREEDVENPTSLLVLPLYHVYALAIGAMNSMRMGAHLVLPPSPRPISNLRPAFEKFEITMLPGINTLFSELLKQDWFVQNPPRSLRWCFSGAAPLSPAVRQKWREVTGVRIFEGYGLTEGTCTVTSSPLDHTDKEGTVGKPLPGTEIRILDDEGNPLPAGQPGEVVIRGPQVMRGYRGRPDATADTIRDGWLHTGDIGILDEDGYLSIVDRKKDMLIVSGFNVYPAEIESVLTGHPGVQEAAVVGVPDERHGEAAWAYVVRRNPDLTSDALAAHCAGALTNYKRPRRFVFVDELPKSPVGKILRRDLRDRARAEAEAGAEADSGAVA